jgi:DNA repair protein RadC
MGEKRASHRITDLDAGERPRERLAHIGANALSNSELIAILIRTGIEGLNAVQLSQQLLLETGGLEGLHRMSFHELCTQEGIGPAKASQIKAAIEHGRRLSIAETGDQASISSPDDVASILQYEMGALEQEHLRVILLDTRNRVMRIAQVYHGSLNASLIRVGEIFKHAVRENAASVIIAHNHPSGDPAPSPEDVAVTRVLVEAGKLLDIEVLDHVIIGRGAYTSMKSRQLGFD